ncbi:MAG: N-acetyltransferase family protein [Bacteroidota bacterium]
MEICLATREDLPVINEIYNQAVRQKFCTAHLSPVSLKQRDAWFATHDPDRFPVFVAVSSERISGWVSMGPYRSGRQAFAHVAEVSYYVDEKERGKGLGSILLEHAIEVSPQFGFSVLVAILLSRNPASIALLEKFGFSQWGSMPGIASIEDQLADHLYYGLKL